MTADDHREHRRRGARKALPTLGAVILCMILATWIGWNAVQTGRADERIAREARIDSCRRGNDLREAARLSNRIVADLLDAVTAPRSREYLAARRALVAHLRANPGDPVARHAVIATRPSPATTQAIALARGELARQDQLLAPVICEDAAAQ